MTLTNKIQWVGEPRFRRPVWPSEPNLQAIESLASSILGVQAVGPWSVTLSANERFTKVYDISSPGLICSYVLRISLPVVPVLKTQNEIATLFFLRAKTSIPVPRVVSCGSTSKDNSGFEWILLQKPEGVTLKSVWGKMPLEKKRSVVHQFAQHMTTLRCYQFDRIGALYFAEKDGKPMYDRSRMSTEWGFVIGKCLDPLLFTDCRSSLSDDMGPFENSSHWLKALLNVQQQFIQEGQALRGDRVALSRAGYQKTFTEHAEKADRICAEYMAVLPQLLGASGAWESHIPSVTRI